MNFLRSLLVPFDPQQHQPRDVGLGGPSTEYLATGDDGSGGVWNIPLIWWDDKGDPHLMEYDDAMMFAQQYEAQTGKRFPRYQSEGAASEMAMNRSAMGGASQNALAQFRR